MKKLSVKLRVTLWYTIAMIITSSIVLFAMISVSKDFVNREVAGRITKTVTDSSRMLGGPHRILNISKFRFYEQGVHMALFDEDSNLLGGQIPFGISAEKLDFHKDTLRTMIYDGNEYYVFDKEIRSHEGGSLWLKGIISLSDENYILSSMSKTNIILTLILIIFAGAGGYFIISRAFVPVNKIRKTAMSISESTDLSQRIHIGDGKDEISELANTFDYMLEQLEQTFEREKQFTSDASHELRTPVAVILSECEYMEECAKTEEEFKESAASVKRQANKMSKLISELLMISRMDKKTFISDFEEINLSELLNFVCEEQREIQPQNISLVCNIEPDIYANADRFLITRLFINLISNAYQYNHENGTIIVDLKKRGNEIQFSVTDNGIGIEPENLCKIWERFYQADPSRTAKENGSMGLGLSMVKQIAEYHKGTVSVTSEAGKGSCFLFCFPGC